VSAGPWTSTTASATSGSTAARRRPWPGSSWPSPSAGTRRWAQTPGTGPARPTADRVSEWVRRAGHGRSPAGSTGTWAGAEGSRGRRWREVVRAVEATAAIRSSLLLELDPEGRFSHLELSTGAGLLTLHPEGDGTLHGNSVTSAGVGHVVALPWDP